jgi:hypothetical protein
MMDEDDERQTFDLADDEDDDLYGDEEELFLEEHGFDAPVQAYNRPRPYLQEEYCSADAAAFFQQELEALAELQGFEKPHEADWTTPLDKQDRGPTRERD